jgi:hypothetical protein
LGGQWPRLFYHDRLGQIVLVTGGPDRGKPASEPLELWGWDGGQWHLIDASGPPWRNFAAVAYDSGRGALVIHGGLQGPGRVFAETWEWDGDSWRLHDGPGPGGREGPGMAYDEGRGRTVLFGGALGLELMGDTWEWDGESWTLVSQSGPAPRFPTAMAYDRARQAVILLNGHAPFGNEATDYHDLWQWDGSQWQEIALTEPNPGLLLTTSPASGPTGNRLLFFGGSDENATFINTIWAWDGVAWEEIPAAGGPRRSGHGVAYDPRLDVFLLFGGVQRPGGPGLNDTWLWDGQDWRCVAGCS